MGELLDAVGVDVKGEDMAEGGVRGGITANGSNKVERTRSCDLTDEMGIGIGLDGLFYRSIRVQSQSPSTAPSLSGLKNV